MFVDGVAMTLEELISVTVFAGVDGIELDPSLEREREEYRQGDCEKQKMRAREEAKDDQLRV